MSQVRVEAGSVWADNKLGNRGRTIRVDSVEAQYAYCTVVTNPDRVQDYLDRGVGLVEVRDVRGRSARVLLSAFRAGPARTGYSPVLARRDADGG